MVFSRAEGWGRGRLKEAAAVKPRGVAEGKNVLDLAFNSSFISGRDEKRNVNIFLFIEILILHRKVDLRTTKPDVDAQRNELGNSQGIYLNADGFLQLKLCSLKKWRELYVFFNRCPSFSCFLGLFARGSSYGEPRSLSCCLQCGSTQC